jgi:hypothetical protein
VAVAFVPKELVDVAEIERFNGRRRKAEYVEPCVKRHHDRGSTLRRRDTSHIGTHLLTPACLVPHPLDIAPVGG